MKMIFAMNSEHDWSSKGHRSTFRGRLRCTKTVCHMSTILGYVIISFDPSLCKFLLPYCQDGTFSYVLELPCITVWAVHTLSIIHTIHMNYNHLSSLNSVVTVFQVLCLSDYLFQTTKTTILYGSDNSTTLRSAL